MKAVVATFVTIVEDDEDSEQLRDLFEQVAGVLARTGMLGALQVAEKDNVPEEAVRALMRGVMRGGAVPPPAGDAN